MSLYDGWNEEMDWLIQENLWKSFAVMVESRLPKRKDVQPTTTPTELPAQITEQNQKVEVK